MRLLVAMKQGVEASALHQRLIRERFLVDLIHEKVEILEFIRVFQYDILLIENSTDSIDAISIIHGMRCQQMTMPIILLNETGDLSYGIASLDAGANDYILRPYGHDDLLARIRVLLREKLYTNTNTEKYSNLVVNRNTMKVYRNHIDVGLSGREFSIIEYMIRNKEIVISRDMIIENALSVDYEGNSNIVDVYIHYIRKKIDRNFSPTLIHTVKNMGYVLSVKGKG